jgi:hypothetical protein
MSHVRTATSYTESLQGFVEQYRSAGEKWPATSREIARWAYHNKLWEPQEKNIVGQLARDLSRAMREEYYTDPQGRRVRTKYAERRVEIVPAEDGEEAKSTQKVFWADIRTDHEDHIIRALQQRRMQIIGDCKQLKTDAESFNDNHPSGKKVQLVFNFEDDLAEMDQPTEYQPPASSE